MAMSKEEYCLDTVHDEYPRVLSRRTGRQRNDVLADVAWIVDQYRHNRSQWMARGVTVELINHGTGRIFRSGGYEFTSAEIDDYLKDNFNARIPPMH